MIRNERYNGLHNFFSPVARLMYVKSRFSLLVVVAVFSMTALCVASSANGDKAGSKSGGVEVDVDNFGRVTEFYYRGAQPKEDNYHQLATIGVKTIIDLRDDPKEYARTMAEQAGLQYINLPMDDKTYPTADAADKFLSLVNDQKNHPVYVHCAGGRHRTGAMTAVFRMKMQGWDVEKAYDEMKDYDFYTRWGHKAMKTYVFDYYRGLHNNRDAALKVSQVSAKHSVANK